MMGWLIRLTGLSSAAMLWVGLGAATLLAGTYGAGYLNGRASVHEGELRDEIADLTRQKAAALKAQHDGAVLIEKLETQKALVIVRTRTVVRKIADAIPDSRACDLGKPAVDLDNSVWMRP